MLQRLLVLLVTAVGITASTLAQQLPESKPVTKPFVHPGVLHSRAELDFIKDKIARGEQPWLAAWGKLQSSQPHRSKRLGTTRSDSRSNSERKRSGSRSRSRRHVAVSSLDYKPSPRAHVERGPSNNPNIGSSDFSHDSIAAYSHALQWQLTGEKAHAEKAIEILNAWSGTLESVSGHDARLLIGMAGIGYCNAAELVRHSDADWKAEDQNRFEQMLRKIFYPTIENFYPSANGNWDASMIQTMLAMGVYLDDRKMFDRAANYFLHGQGNGAIENYFNAFGECQESGRDQAHTQMGIGFLGAACEIAWKREWIFTVLPIADLRWDLSTRRNTTWGTTFAMSRSRVLRAGITIASYPTILAVGSRRSTNASFITITIGSDLRCPTVVKWLKSGGPKECRRLTRLGARCCFTVCRQA